MSISVSIIGASGAVGTTLTTHILRSGLLGAYDRLQLVGRGVPRQMRLGLDGRICTGSYAVAQAWSDALRRHPEKPDGILFPSRHELSLPSCAIFDSAESELRWERLGSLDEPRFVDDLSTLLAMGAMGLDP
jgi:RES domain